MRALAISLIVSAAVWVGMYLWFPISIFDSLNQSFGSTITTILGSDTLSSSRAVINTNFSNLNTDKLQSGDTAAALTITSGTVGTLTLTNDLTVANGGTGASTLTGLLIGNGTSAFTADAIPLDVQYGGTGWVNLQANYLLYGNGTTRIGTSSDLYWDSTNSRLGLASTTPAYGLSLGSQKTIGMTEYAVSTSTSITIDARNGNQQLVRMGGAATTIAFSNMGNGTTIRLVVCNPTGNAAGAITWSGVRFVGSAPTQTTTANKCDLYVVGSSQATSTTATTPIVWLSQGFAGL